jgi:hypothetical protein
MAFFAIWPSESGDRERRVLGERGAVPGKPGLAMPSKASSNKLQRPHVDKLGYGAWWRELGKEQIESFLSRRCTPKICDPIRARNGRFWPSGLNWSATLRQRAAMPETHHQVTGRKRRWKPTPLFEAAILAVLPRPCSRCCSLWLGNKVLQGDTQHFDLAIRAWVHGFASPGITRASDAISSWLQHSIAELLIAFAFFARLRWRRAAVWLAVAMTGALALDLTLNAYQRTRPTGRRHGRSLTVFPADTRSVLFVFTAFSPDC